MAQRRGSKVADRDLHQPAGARSVHRQGVRPDHGVGEFNLRNAGRGGAGKIASSPLEGANVDLAEEFTKMIVTQRAHSANARVITTTDEMLDELIRISR
jgi:flagellar hook protein FlgE